MRSRRHFLQLSFAALLVSAARAALSKADPPDVPIPTPVPTSAPTFAAPETPHERQQVLLPLMQSSEAPVTVPFIPAAVQAHQQIYLPLVQTSAPPLIGAPLLGPASGSAAQAIAWLAARDIYSNDIARIVNTYQRIGEQVGLDWFLALAQMAHETGSLTSWWSQPPRRNLAGIGVTGEWRAGLPDGSPGPAPGSAWVWSAQLGCWLAGVSFPTWGSDAVPAHLGRLLAYTLPAGQGDLTQQSLIAKALSYRALPASHRNSAPTILGLNGRWAVPGTEYGQRIMALAAAMRQF
jgi:Mannosyl-glycoprotein endo-beta-N-acetylglucosaminidase